jgi:hypothetical protein
VFLDFLRLDGTIAQKAEQFIIKARENPVVEIFFDL